jgi:hypothetical protein
VSPNPECQCCQKKLYSKLYATAASRAWKRAISEDKENMPSEELQKKVKRKCLSADQRLAMESSI